MSERRNDLVIVEDDPEYRLLIRVTLGTDPRLEMSGEAPTLQSGIELAHQVAPRLIILDHNLEGEMVGLTGAPMLKAVAPGAKILLFTAQELEDEASREPAIDAFVRKDEPAKLLPTAQRLLGLQPLEAPAGR